MENGTFARRPHRLQWITDKAREKWWDEQYAELDKHETRKDGSFM